MLYLNSALKIQIVDEIIPSVSLPEELCMLSDKEFYIRDYILNEAAYAACNGSKKNNLFGGYCIITDAGRSTSIRWKCNLNQWNLNNVHTSEGYLFLMLLELIYKVSYRLKRGKIVLYMDRKSLIKEITAPPLKPS